MAIAEVFSSSRESDEKRLRVVILVGLGTIIGRISARVVKRNPQNENGDYMEKVSVRAEKSI